MFHRTSGERDVKYGVAGSETRPDFVVLPQPIVEIALQLLNGHIDLAAKGDPVELIEHRPVETLDDAVGLQAFDLGAA